MPTVDALKKSMAREAIQKDITIVLRHAKAESLDAEVRAILADGRVTESTLAPGTTMEWMAFRRAKRPVIMTNLRWDGKAPLKGYDFIVDDMSQTYSFFVPADCGNLVLLKREPSREAARRAAEAARAEAARQEAARAEAARAEAARQEAARAEAARVEAARVEAARVEAARVEALRIETARAAAAKAEADRLEAARLEALKQAEALERALRVRPFFAPMVGKQHGLAGSSDGCGGCFLAGLKGGVSIALGKGWRFAPAVGFASNLEEGGRTALLIDGSFDYVFKNGAYLGTGPTLWDLNHSDNRTAGWLFGGGVRVWQNDAKKHEAHWVVEWRQMFNEANEPHDVRRMFWTGVRFLFK
ncbi:MAG TPA: hypothetical protein VN700_00215 [Vicinamibacterales bacterium]|nr:hypothetical protein [Vicinamibacterales bacterium]